MTKPLLPVILSSFYHNHSFYTNSLVWGIFLSTFAIFFSRFCISGSYCVLKTNLLMLGNLTSTALTFVVITWNTAYLTILLSSLSLTLLKTLGTMFNLLISNLSISEFKLGKSLFLQILMYQQLLLLLRN